MNKLKKEKIKKLKFDYTYITMTETYVDDNGKLGEKEKKIKVPVFAKSDINVLIQIAEKIGNEIKMLNAETEFTIQNFINNYNVEEKDKLVLCNLVVDYCKNKNIIIVEKETGQYLGLPWDIIRIKKN